MQYPLNLSGFEGHQVIVKAASFFSRAKLLIDGQPAPKGSKRGQLLLQRNDGVQVVAQLRNSLFDPIPQVIIDGQSIRLAKALAWYQWLFIGFPIVLLFMGGALGGGLGASAIYVNSHIFRSELSGVVKYGAVILFSVGSFVLYFLLAVLFSLLMQR